MKANELNKAAEEYAQDEIMSGLAERAFKAGAEWQREQYECIPAEEEYMRGFAQGAKEERGDIITRIRNQVKLWMPDNPEGDEYIEGKKLAFRSVLVLLDKMEQA